MHIDRPEFENEAGGEEEERDESDHSGKWRGNTVLRKRKVLEDERAPVLDACGVRPCVTKQAIVVATRELVDGGRAKSVELRNMGVSTEG